MPASIDKFLEATPDGATKASDSEEKDSVQITLRVNKNQLQRLTAIARRQGIPRASYIKRAVFLQLEADEKNEIKVSNDLIKKGARKRLFIVLSFLLYTLHTFAATHVPVTGMGIVVAPAAGTAGVRI